MVVTALFGASFVGSPSMNLFDATLNEGTFLLGSLKIETGLKISSPVRIGIRPESIKFNGRIRAKVVLIENLGARFLVETRIEDTSLMVLSEQRPESDTLTLRIDPGDIHVFDKITGKSLRCSSAGSTGNPQR